jgi:hypothetical protein
VTKSGLKRLVATAAIFTMTVATTTAGAATKGRIIPTDTVTFHKDGQVIAKFTEQAPINDSAMITCNKACSVRLDGMSLNVSGETTFAVRQDGESLNLYVKEGLAIFSVSNVTQQVSFYTPDGRYVKTEGFIAPASTTSAVKGYMNVTDTQAQIGIEQGGMILATADGVQTIDPGYTYTIDLNALPATGAIEESGGWTTGQIAAGVVVAGLATWGVYELVKDDDDDKNKGSDN